MRAHALMLMMTGDTGEGGPRSPAAGAVPPRGGAGSRSGH